MRKNYQLQKGFTLVELMVVIVIMGILVVIGVSTFMSSQRRSRDSRRKSDLSNIALALEAYYNDKGQYPNDNGTGKMAGCYPDDTTVCAWGEAFKDKNSTIYMMVLPEDMKTSQNYYYDASAVSGKYAKYQLYARLENTLDADISRNAGDVAQSYASTDCGGGILCNYAVTSSNVLATDNHALTPP